jgi:2-dehydropantoate 2-reductase
LHPSRADLKVPARTDNGAEEMDKRIVVMGAGAIGGYTGGNLAHNGFDVTLVDPWPEHIEAIRRDGLALDGITPEEFVLARPKTLHLTEVQRLAKERPVDIAFVSMKSYDTEWATTMIRQYLAPSGYVVSLQNCINEEKIAGVVGWGRTVGAVAALLSAELYAPGKIRRTGAKNPPGHEVYRVGEVHGRATKRIEELGALLRSVDSCKVTDNLWGERWSKLCVNGMHNGVSAASGLSGNAMRQDDRIRRVIVKLGGEAVRIGQAQGYRLEEIAGQDAETLARAAEGDPAALDQVESLMLALRNTQQRSAQQRPSMGQDMQKGRRTEIDFINGVIVQKGRETGLPAPTHEKLIAAVKRVELGEAAPAPEHIYAIAN